MKFQSPSSVGQSGQLLVLVLVFAGVFMILISAFVGSMISQSQSIKFRYDFQQATDIAESGLNYYRWYLAHNPGDISGGGVYEYIDQELGTRMGEFELNINSNSYCGQVASIEVESRGRSDNNPAAEAVISATYKRPTVSEYSFITNSGVWFGGGSLVGPIHSNQGLRMEAAHNSAIGSGQATWNCDSSFGCDPEISNAPGVYSSGSLSTPGLFQYPVDPIDFAGLTLDLSLMRTLAQNSGGIHFGPTSDWGYLVNFNGDSTVDISRVTGTESYRSYPGSGCCWIWTERNIITSSVLIADDVPIDNDCPILFLEDKVWVQGTINQKVSLAAADLDDTTETNIVINDDVTYVPGANAGFLAIAEDDVDINLVIPGENLDLHGIYIAQDGRFGRDQYSTSVLPSYLDPFVVLGNFTFLGTQVSNQRAVTNWVSGGTVFSGFGGSGGGSSFDRDQIDNPPPLTPTTNDVYELQDWRQEG